MKRLRSLIPIKPKFKTLSLKQPNLKNNNLKTWGWGMAIVLISAFLISQSVAAPFKRYQAYREAIVSLQALESNFSQEILTSRYELFASYDGLVTNLAEQEILHRQLSDIPAFVNAQAAREMTRILQERQTALTQKEDLSEWFKSRNALLKNSLRYLPFLTRQIESSFDANPQPVKPNKTAEAKETVGANEPKSTKTTGPTTPPTATVSTSTIALSPAQRATLRGTLNQLIRNLLLYNASGETQVAEQAEALTQKLADLENTFEIPEEALPTQVFRAHANVILTTKPLVEDLTGQLLLSPAQHTDELASTLEQAYQQAGRRASLFRSLTLVWFLSLMGGANYWYVKRYGHRDPALERYRQQMATLANTAQQLDSIVTQPSNQPSNQSSNHPSNQRPPQNSPASQIQIEEPLASLKPFLNREDDLGHLARHLQAVGDRWEKSQAVHSADTFTFLTARLSLLTKHRRKLINAEAAAAVRTALEATLANQDCQLLDLQLAADQVSVQFSYPLSLSLETVVQQLRQTAATAIEPMARAIEPALQSPEDIWSETALIASCESSTEQTMKAPLMAVPGDLP